MTDLIKTYTKVFENGSFEISKEYYNEVVKQIDQNIVITKLGKEDYMATCRVRIEEGMDILDMREIVPTASSEKEARELMEKVVTRKIRKVFEYVNRERKLEEDIKELEAQILAKRDEITANRKLINEAANEQKRYK